MYINPNNSLIQDPVIASALKLFFSAGEREKVKKGQLILMEGQICDFLFFVESGAFRAFRWIDDKEVTIGFSFKGDIDTCPYAFFNNLPSSDIIEALTDGKIVKVKKKDMVIAPGGNNGLTDLFTYLLSHYVEILIRRSIEHRILTAEEIYLNLITRQPGEAGKIPLQYIASYLGISKERLSRIRKKQT